MPRRDILLLTIVSVAGFVAIVGFSAVATVKYGSSGLWPLVESAQPGGLIAAGAAAIFLVGSLFLRARDSIAIAAVISILMVGVHAFAIVKATQRIDGGESYDGDVLVGLSAYWAALALQATAVVIGMVRWRQRRA